MMFVSISSMLRSPASADERTTSLVLEDYLNRRYLERNLAWAAACDPSLVASLVSQRGVAPMSLPCSKALSGLHRPVGTPRNCASARQ
jgi:hypothetical protein